VYYFPSGVVGKLRERAARPPRALPAGGGPAQPAARRPWAASPHAAHPL